MNSRAIIKIESWVMAPDGETRIAGMEEAWGADFVPDGFTVHVEEYEDMVDGKERLRDVSHKRSFELHAHNLLQIDDYVEWLVGLMHTPPLESIVIDTRWLPVIVEQNLNALKRTIKERLWEKQA